MTYTTFAELLDRHLRESGWTAKELGSAVGYSSATISRWRTGRHLPTDPWSVVRIADTLGIFDPTERRALFRAAGYLYEAPRASDDDHEDGDGERERSEPTLSFEHEFTGSPPIASSARVDAHVAPPFMVPPLPPQGLVGREDTLAEIRKFLSEKGDVTANKTLLVLSGVGGIGKTALLTAFGRMENTRREFPDGVVWASLGPTPNTRFLLEKWGRAVGLDLTTEPDEDACVDRLRSALFGRRMLLIIDDIWDFSHFSRFAVAGPQSRILLTTREPRIAHIIATRQRTLRVDVLKPESALALLRSLAPEAVARDLPSARTLCERLEFLPLAITLAGRLLADEADIPSRQRRVLRELIERREARLRLPAVEGRLGLSDDKPVSLQAILGMSVERLNQTDQERFAMSAVFGGEPLSWDIGAAAAVWECSEEEAEATTARFVQLGLLERRDGRLWMQALLVDYAEEMRVAHGL